MKTKKIIWLSGLTVMSANIAVFLSNLAVMFSGLRPFLILCLLGAIWFFKCQWNEGLREAIANTLDFDEEEYVVILCCILLGGTVGGLGTWINQIL